MSNNSRYQTLSQVVKEFLVASGNDIKKFYINYMIHAKWIWKELFLKTQYAVRSKYVKVDKTTNPYSIPVPTDMLRFINISTEDRAGNLSSFVFDELINVTALPTGRECHTCGETDDYGQCINNISAVTKTVVINGQGYTEKIWKEVTPKGDIVEVRDIPTVDIDAQGAETIVTVRRQTFIANLDIKPCGCIRKTTVNRDKINSCAGVLLTETMNAYLQPNVSKVGTKQGRIKIAHGRIWLSGNVPDWVILSYQTNGVCCEEEILVPEEFVQAMVFGISYRSRALSADATAERSRIAYDREVQKLDEFLNPIRAEEFMNVQGVLPRWGSAIDQSYMRLGHSCFYDCENIPTLPGKTDGITVEQVKEMIEALAEDVTVINNYYQTPGGYAYTQSSPVMSAVIVHTMDYVPAVTITDLNDVVIEGRVSYPTDSSVKVEFNTPLTFKVFLS